MSAAYFLGVDIGTYSSKGVLVKETGEVVASRTVEHPLEMPHPGWAEHDAETTWWKDFLEIVRALLQSSSVSPRQIAAAGFSAISPAVLPIDREGRPLRKAILYGIRSALRRRLLNFNRSSTRILSYASPECGFPLNRLLPRYSGFDATSLKCGRTRIWWSTAAAFCSIA